MKSARVAVALKRIGIDRVWVLEGGLKAWREQGFPVARSLELPEVVAKRLGVKLPERTGSTADRDELTKLRVQSAAETECPSSITTGIDSAGGAASDPASESAPDR